MLLKNTLKNRKCRCGKNNILGLLITTLSPVTGCQLLEAGFAGGKILGRPLSWRSPVPTVHFPKKMRFDSIIKPHKHNAKMIACEYFDKALCFEIRNFITTLVCIMKSSSAFKTAIGHHDSASMQPRTARPKKPKDSTCWTPKNHRTASPRFTLPVLCQHNRLIDHVLVSVSGKAESELPSWSPMPLPGPSPLG